MASVILKLVGIKRTEVVLLLSGWLISIPVFSESRGLGDVYKRQIQKNQWLN